MSLTLIKRMEFYHKQHDVDPSLNLQMLLNELKRISSVNGYIEREQFESELKRLGSTLRGFLKVLVDRGCIQCVNSQGSRGRPGLARIKILNTRVVPESFSLSSVKHTNEPSLQTSPKRFPKKCLKKLESISFQRGAGSLEKNLQTLLDALWVVEKEGVLVRSQFESESRRCSKYFKALEVHGCIKTLYEGRSIGKITLLGRVVPIAKTTEKKEQPKKSIPTVLPPAPPGRRWVLTDSEPLPAQNKTPKVEKECTLAFVDAPNLTAKRAGVDQDGSRVLPIDRVPWGALRIKMEAGYQKRLCLDKVWIYSIDRVCSIHTKTHIFSEGFIPVIYEKDIDPLLAGDMGFYGRDILESYDILNIVLFSGDGDYVRVLETLSRFARIKKKQLNIWIITWRRNLSHRLRNIATRIDFLEDIPEISGMVFPDQIKNRASGF